jgi:hypothetical protein
VQWGKVRIDARPLCDWFNRRLQGLGVNCVSGLDALTQPPIPDAEAIQRLCLDYMRQTVPANSLGEAIGLANERPDVFDNCLRSHGWAE